VKLARAHVSRSRGARAATTKTFSARFACTADVAPLFRAACLSLAQRDIARTTAEPLRAVLCGCLRTMQCRRARWNLRRTRQRPFGNDSLSSKVSDRAQRESPRERRGHGWPRPCSRTSCGGRAPATTGSSPSLPPSAQSFAYPALARCDQALPRRGRQSMPLPAGANHAT
jgi:hypothetical protein